MDRPLSLIVFSSFCLFCSKMFCFFFWGGGSCFDLFDLTLPLLFCLCFFAFWAWLYFGFVSFLWVWVLFLCCASANPFSLYFWTLFAIWASALFCSFSVSCFFLLLLCCSLFGVNIGSSLMGLLAKVFFAESLCQVRGCGNSAKSCGNLQKMFCNDPFPNDAISELLIAVETTRTNQNPCFLTIVFVLCFFGGEFSSVGSLVHPCFGFGVAIFFACYRGILWKTSAAFISSAKLLLAELYVICSSTNSITVSAVCNFSLRPFPLILSQTSRNIEMKILQSWPCKHLL